jgi:hypothetical protein
MMATPHQTCGAPADRARLVNIAFRLEWLTIAWMLIEAAVACAAALAAHSIALMAFGIDSLIELASAAVLIWRLSVELQQGADFPSGRSVRPRALLAVCCLSWRSMSLPQHCGRSLPERARASPGPGWW